MAGDLVKFLRERLDEDEAAAKLVESVWPGETITRVLAAPERYALMQHDVSPTRAAHITRHDPVRVLREVAAKRAIVADYENTDGDSPRDRERGRWDRSHAAVRHLAAVYSHHPDYRPEWAPKPYQAGQ